MIALDPDGVQRHHGDCRVSPLDDRESNTRELKSAPALMTECDWRTPGGKTCQDVRYHKGWHSTTLEHRPRGNNVFFFLNIHALMVSTIEDTESSASL